MEVIAVGVPEMTPVEVSRDKPAGRDGETAHDTTAPPLDVGAVSYTHLTLPTILLV